MSAGDQLPKASASSECPELRRLVDIVARLRAPQGCPWDREQTHQTLRPYLLEETYEALEALDAGDARKLCEELGDLLIQVLLHAVIASERGEFDLEAVARATSEKLIRRHPHVFGSVEVTGPSEVVHNWEQIKRGEEGNRARTSALDGVPRELPGLAGAWSVQKKAARVGFDWDDDRGPWAKLREELAELEAAQAAGEAERVEAELGDVLFAVVNLSRFLHADAEAALRTATERFSQRFRRIETLAAVEGKRLADMSLAEMDLLWERAKQDEDESEGRPAASDE